MDGTQPTVVDAWDKRWATPEGRAEWLMPDPAVRAVAAELKARGARHALDLGCGVGRHALHLAAEGFTVEAIDGSAAGVAETQAAAQSHGLALSVRQGAIDELPFADQSFDYVLSWNVIYHGTLGDAARRLAAIWRILKPGGLYQGTMLSTRNVNYGQGRLIAPNTFVIDGVEEKSHAHCYCDAGQLAALLTGFELLSLTQDEQGKTGAWHWHLVAQRRD
ncbi:MAG TPA: class I SAM-dependent methyltransferase [Stellaceae bacterium]|jgi:2-polyprenyl-3-methyl-5-hydroxy-6-metoxy-1,4-benzoquinol methylase|nr:class I SAM-dependent methyltransferase [Stellaceae bacterium]